MAAPRLAAKPPTRLWLCRDLPLWVRVALYATEHHGVRLAPGELRRVLDPQANPSDLSRAIKRGIIAGLLAHDSSARALYTLVRNP